MKILVTNDDGVDAEGLGFLTRALSRDHEVWVVAPDHERSGASHSVNLHEPCRLYKKTDKIYSCSGTPADCVMFARLGIIPFDPDIVVSGINRGPNLGTDILYSGTCAAARQAALFDIPGIAVSCATRNGPFLYRAAASFVAANLERLVSYCSESVFMNVNAPSMDCDLLEGIWTGVSRRHYHDSVRPVEEAGGHIVCYLEPGKIESISESHGDEAVVASGRVSVSPVLVHPQVRTGVSFGESFR